MNRLMAAVVTLVFVQVAGVSHAQVQNPRPMPEKVRNYLDKLVGTWNLDSEALKARVVMEWDPAKNFLAGSAKGRLGVFVSKASLLVHRIP